MKTTPIKGTMFLSIATFVFMLSGYIINVLLGRLLGPVDYGIYGIIISLIAFVNIIQTTGVTQAVSKHIAESKTNSDSLLKTGLLLQTIVSFTFFLIFFFLAEFIVNLFHDSSLTPYIRISSFIFPIFGYYALYLDYYNGLHFFKRQALMNILYSISKVILIFSLAFYFKLFGVFYGVVFASTLPLLVGLRLPNFKTTFFPIKKLILFSLPLIGIAISSNLLLSVDLFAVKIMLPEKESPGFYTAGQNIAKIIFYSMTAFFLVIFPAISHAVSNNLYDKVKTIIQNSLRVIFLLICPATFILSATSRELILFIYSDKYMTAAPSLSILFFGVGAFTFFTALSYILSGAGKPQISSLFSFIGLLISIILCIVLIPLYDLRGAALATTVGCTFALILASRYVINHFHAFIPIKSIFRILLSSGIIYLIAHLQFFHLLFLPLFYLFLLLLYIVLLVIFKEITKEDISLLKSFLPSRDKTQL